MMDHGPESIIDRLRTLAHEDPEHVALQTPEERLTRGQLEERSNEIARQLSARGTREGDFVSIVLPNGPEFLASVIASWKVGAVPNPLNPRLANAELAGVLDLVEPRLVITDDHEAAHGHPVVLVGDPIPASGAVLDPDVVSPAWKAIGSGGSTGRPKIIVTPQPAYVAQVDETRLRAGVRSGEVCVIPAPLTHNGPFFSAVQALTAGGRVVLTGRFDGEELLAIVERERAGWLYLVPTMMSRIWKLPEDVRARYDLSSLQTVIHMGAPCPTWLKHAWIDWLGGERILELYTGTESATIFTVRGDEWLRRPGTVGRPVTGEVQVRDLDGNTLPAGSTGKIWTRGRPGQGEAFRYLGATPALDAEGWQTLGDIGRLDEDGYLFIEDRETDMILVGGSNVYPAEIESVLLEHPVVLDACVIGLPDDDLGQIPHAIVHTSKPLPEAALVDHVRLHLAPYKVPRSFEFVGEPLRDAAGKVRRQKLRADRTGTGSNA